MKTNEVRMKISVHSKSVVSSKVRFTERMKDVNHLIACILPFLFFSHLQNKRYQAFFARVRRVIFKTSLKKNTDRDQFL